MKQNSMDLDPRHLDDGYGLIKVRRRPQILNLRPVFCFQSRRSSHCESNAYGRRCLNPAAAFSCPPVYVVGVLADRQAAQFKCVIETDESASNLAGRFACRSLSRK
jgi:hypothetical protein